MIEIPLGQRVWGIQLPVQAQSSYFVAEWERSAGPDEMVQIAQACDRAGSAYVGVCDHIALPEAVADSMGTHWADPISTLAFLAGQTSKVGLLTHVFVLPYRHPLAAAKHFSTIDHLSGGRLICGIGAGHVEAEFDHLDKDFSSRGRALNDGIPQLAEALENEFVDGFGARPRPVQSPRPPIWVAGSSPAAIRRAARLGDGWLPQGPSNAEMVELLRSEREINVRADRPFAIGHITPVVHVGTPGWDVGSGVVSGSPEEVASGLLAGAADGVNQLQVRFAARSVGECCEQIETFGADVAPLLKCAA